VFTALQLREAELVGPQRSGKRISWKNVLNFSPSITALRYRERPQEKSGGLEAAKSLDTSCTVLVVWAVKHKQTLDHIEQ